MDSKDKFEKYWAERRAGKSAEDLKEMLEDAQDHSRSQSLLDSITEVLKAGKSPSKKQITDAIDARHEDTVLSPEIIAYLVKRLNEKGKPGPPPKLGPSDDNMYRDVEVISDFIAKQKKLQQKQEELQWMQKEIQRMQDEPQQKHEKIQRLQEKLQQKQKEFQQEYRQRASYTKAIRAVAEKHNMGIKNVEKIVKGYHTIVHEIGKDHEISQEKRHSKYISQPSKSVLDDYKQLFPKPDKKISQT